MIKNQRQGHLLAASPSNPQDHWSKSVILVVSHTPTLSIGLQINHPIRDLDLRTVSNNLGIWCDVDEPVFYGGNIGSNKIHVVHSLDWSGLTTIPITEKIGVTNDISVIAALSRDEGPEYFRACAGYWHWEENQLEQQLEARPENTLVRYRWESVPATIENIFTGDSTDQWRRVLEESAKHQAANWF